MPYGKIPDSEMLDEMTAGYRIKIFKKMIFGTK